MSFVTSGIMSSELDRYSFAIVALVTVMREIKEEATIA